MSADEYEFIQGERRAAFFSDDLKEASRLSLRNERLSSRANDRGRAANNRRFGDTFSLLLKASDASHG
jgi:hypothetical protein